MINYCAKCGGLLPGSILHMVPPYPPSCTCLTQGEVIKLRQEAGLCIVCGLQFPCGCSIQLPIHPGPAPDLRKIRIDELIKKHTCPHCNGSGIIQGEDK